MERKYFDAVIIGAGPSGLFSAVILSSVGLSVCVLEKTDSAGKKLLISGSGKCNLTNSSNIDQFIRHYGGKDIFVKKALMNFPPDSLISFFRNCGIGFKEEKKGKVFPEKGGSREILAALLKKCHENVVEILYNSSVLELSKTENIFSVKYSGGTIRCPYLLVCTGGVSYPLTGSTGDGYTLAQYFGHTLVSPLPSLNSVSVNDYFLSGCSGISLENRRVCLFRNGRKILEHRDDLLFTHSGLSGPVILNMCRYIRRGDVLMIDCSDRGENFDSDFRKLLMKNGKSDLKNVLQKLDLPERFTASVLKHIGIPGNIKCAVLSGEYIRSIVRNLSSLEFIVRNVDDIKTAMATAGGISLKEVASGTMESKICPNLFFAGEVLDVDGDTGGYNLQWAFSSARLAADTIIKRIENEK